MSVYFYKQEFTSEMPPMESSDALILGIVAGIIGALFMMVLRRTIFLVLGAARNRNGAQLYGEVEDAEIRRSRISSRGYYG